MGAMERIRRLVTGSRDEGVLVVENTGPATHSGDGAAVTGYAGPPPRRGQKVVVKNTGAATATGDSDAVSGIDWT